METSFSLQNPGVLTLDTKICFIIGTVVLKSNTHNSVHNLLIHWVPKPCSVSRNKMCDVHVVLRMKIVNTAVLTWSYKPGRESQYSLAFSERCGMHRFVRTYKHFRQPIQRTSTALSAAVCRRQTADDDADSVWFHLQGTRIQKKFGTDRLSRNVGTELPLLAAK